MKKNMIKCFLSEMEKSSSFGAMLNLGFNAMSIPGKMTEYGAMKKLTHPLMPGGAAENAMGQFAGGRNLSGQTPNMPHYSLY